MRTLVGDIGGTKTELALFEADSPRPTCSARYPSAEFEQLEAVVKRFCADHQIGEVDAAAFGIAGPIRNGQCRTTNLPWIVDQKALSQQLSCPVKLLNDFEAVALGVTSLLPDQVHILNDSQPELDGPIAIIGAGTGLGQAIVVPSEQGARVLSSEGGHCDLAPRNEVEIALLRFLLKRHARVSVERVVSGPGLVTLYEFVTETGHVTESDAARKAIAAGDAAATISQLGQEGKDPACAEAVRLFVELYGAEAGNLALKVLPTGGLYIAGGIAPKMLPALTDGRFTQALFHKGRMSPLLTALPIAIVLEPQVALLGARNAAHELPKNLH